MPELPAFVSSLKIDILSVVETWLSQDITDSCLGLDDYIVFRKDRPSAGGGVMFAVRKSLNPECINIPTNFELLGIKLNHESFRTKLFLAYRPPGLSSAENDAFISSIDEAICSNDNYVLMGDFNYPSIDWRENDSVLASEMKFLEMTVQNGLQQIVNEPTRGPNLLDLVLTTPNVDAKAEVLCPYSTADHNSVLIDIEAVSPHVTPSWLHDFRGADWPTIHAYMSAIDWVDLFDGCSLDQMWINFKTILNFVLSNFIPQKCALPRNLAPWFTPHIKRLARKKQKLHRKMKRRPTIRNKNEFKNFSRYLKHEVEFAKADYEKRKFSNKATNPKQFFNYINSRSKPASDVQVLHTPYAHACTPYEKCEILANQFASVYTIDNSIMPPCPPKMPHNSIHEITVTRNDVFHEIQNLKPSSSPGPDKIPPLLVKKIGCHLVSPLTMLFRKSLATGSLPDDWKTADVIPIYKNNRKPHDPASYRPISMTSVFCKMLERIIIKYLNEYFSRFNLFNQQQHGFLKGKSTLTNLLETSKFITDLTDIRGNNVDVIYLDLAKAFDTVSHVKLLEKIKQCGVGGNLHKWISDFLNNRRQSVKIGDAVSECFIASSGVPQGSCLSSILFLIYINDLCSVTAHSSIKLFADDAKVYRLVNNPDDAQLLQHDLNEIGKFFDDWQLKVNVEKCNSLHIGYSNLLESYTLNQSTIASSPEVNDLGYLMSTNCGSKKYIFRVAATAHFRVKQLNIAFNCRDVDFKLFLFVTYIRPILEYVTPIWCPHLINEIDRLESVQRRFTKFLPGYRNLSYVDRLRRLNIKSLEERRIMFDLILVFKIINNLISLDSRDYFEFASSITRGHNLKIKTNYCRTNTKKFSFPNRIINCWNNLPDDVVNSTSLSIFKSKVQKSNFHQYCRGSAFRFI